MKSLYRPLVFLACLLLSIFSLVQSAPAQSQIHSFQNPRPTILGFGREGCSMCVYMEKTLRQLKVKYGDRINVQVAQYDDLKLYKKYKVALVPTQIFLDASGKEVFRQTGVFTLFELEKKLKELKLIQIP